MSTESDQTEEQAIDDELRRIAGVTHRPLSSIIAMAEKLDTAENTIPALAESEMA